MRPAAGGDETSIFVGNLFTVLTEPMLKTIIEK